MAEPPAVPPQDQDHRVPFFHLEWMVAAMIGIGIAVGAAGAVAYLESSRFPPAPPAESGAREWGTARTRPPKTSAPEVLDEVEDSVVEETSEPVIDVEISHSGRAPADSQAIGSDSEPGP